MNATAPSAHDATPRSDAAKQRLLALKGEPLVFVEWRRVLFLHYEIEPAILRAQVPPLFELDLHRGKAVVSLIALTMQRFRPNPAGPVWAQLCRTISEQRFLNLRSYVRHGDEPGAFFFWSWLSRPWGLPWPSRPLGLSCEFAQLHYGHEHERGNLSGEVIGRGDGGRFAYRAHLSQDCRFVACAPGSLAEFALERYTGYFWHHGAGRLFRAWHPPWLQAPVEAGLQDESLVMRSFPWLRQGRFVEADYSPGFQEVWLGRPQAGLSLPQASGRQIGK